MKTSFLVFLCLVASLCARAQLHSFTDLGTWGSYTYLTPTGINNNGDVVGTAYESAGRPVAFRHREGSFTGSWACAFLLGQCHQREFTHRGFLRSE